MILAYETVAISGQKSITFNTTLFLLDLISLINKVQNKILIPIAEYDKGLSHWTWRDEADPELELSEGPMHEIGATHPNVSSVSHKNEPVKTSMPLQ